MPILKDNLIVTVQQHIIEQQGKDPNGGGEFGWLLSAITLSTKIISSYVRRAGLIDVWGAESGATNVQDEVVQKLDRISNETLKHTLGYRGNVGVIASEEDAEPKVLQEVGATGKYIVMFDPLDGSSNIDTNVSVGTIFTILGNPPEIAGTAESCLQPGLRQLAAGYVVYGSSTVLVLTTQAGEGVNMYTLDNQFGAFLLTRENLKMPEYANEYSCNEAYRDTFPSAYQRYLNWTRLQDGGKCSMRYIGSLVADFHRILLKGGVFFYPETAKNPQGKLRLMYEANPLAMIAEKAGGMATDGRQRILEIQPKGIHERTPLVIGSRRNVEDVHRFIAEG